VSVAVAVEVYIVRKVTLVLNGLLANIRREKEDCIQIQNESDIFEYHHMTHVPESDGDDFAI
jgi:hypothetical protein